MFDKILDFLFFAFGIYSVILGIFTKRKAWMSIYRDDIENTSFAPYYNKLTNIVLGLIAIGVGYMLIRKQHG